MKIKYDKTEQKICKTIGIICVIAFLISLLEIIVEIPLPAFWIAFCCMVFIASIPIGIVSWYGYLESLLYFKELEKIGIEPPLHKNDPEEIQRILAKAEQNRQAGNRYVSAEQNAASREADHNKASMVLAVIAFIVSAGTLIWVLWYMLHFVRLGMGGEIGFPVLVSLLGSFLWSVGGIVYWKQRSNEKYKNDGDPTPGKKVRSGPAKGIFTILILLCVTFFAFHTIYEMSQYVYYTKLEVIFGPDWRLHKGERVDTDHSRTVTDDGIAHLSEFPL